MSDPSIAEMKAQIAAIEAQIKAKQNAARDGAIAKAREIIREFGLTQAQVFGSGAAAKSGKSPKVFKYVNGKDKWTGGRGRVPDWVKAIQAAGGNIEKYRVA
jgi:DNA-binding protein H-NS